MPSFAQPAQPEAPGDSTTALVPASEAPFIPPIMSKQEFSLSSQLLVFAFAIVVVEAFVIKLSAINSDGAIRLLTVTLILISILYLTTAGYGSQQITAATGLLGTIAGYLLGRSSGRDNQPTP